MRCALALALALLGLALAPGGAAASPPEIGGSFVPATGPCLTPAARSALRLRLARATQELGLARGATTAPPPVLQWPLRGELPDDPGYHGISGFVDHEPRSPGHVLDFECGTRSYDLADGYDHRGTDFFLWPFPWNKMDREEVLVVAAAPGIILGIDDGHGDRSCGIDGGAWNAVYIRHDDESQAWYGHLKQGTTIDKLPGQTVSAGEVLGVVGSSGQSTGPHLHLELYDNSAQLVDPWAGPCNPTVAASWWADQRPYHDSAINALRTASSFPDFGQCPDPELEYEARHFQAGDTVRFLAYLRDQTDDAPASYAILRPDGSSWDSWQQVLNVPHYAASYWGWSRTLPADAPDGQWIFRASYEGQVVERGFVVGEGVAVSRADLRGARRDGSVELAWELPAGLELDALRVERQLGEHGPRSAQPVAVGDGRLREPDPAPGEPLVYRLLGVQSGNELELGALRLGAPGRRLELRPFSPNPLGPGGGQALLRLPGPAEVHAEVVDLAGRRLATLARGAHPAGELALAWDGRDGAGRPVAAGVYLLRVRAGGRQLQAKLLRLR